MDSLNDRRDAFESKFAHDETLRFKAYARRNKMLGLWAAGVLGKDGVEADAYADGIVQAGVGDPTLALSKISADFTGMGIDPSAVAAKSEEFLAAATEQVTRG